MHHMHLIMLQFMLIRYHHNEKKYIHNPTSSQIGHIECMSHNKQVCRIMVIVSTRRSFYFQRNSHVGWFTPVCIRISVSISIRVLIMILLIHTYVHLSQKTYLYKNIFINNMFMLICTAYKCFKILKSVNVWHSSDRLHFVCDVLSRSKSTDADADADTNSDADADSWFTYVFVHSLISKT